MFCWATAESYEWNKIEAISLVLSNHSNLLEFLFDKHAPELRHSPERLLRGSSEFSSGEQILIRVALDLWCGTRTVFVLDLLEKLDDSNFQNVLVGLQYLGGNMGRAGTLSFAN